MTDAPASTDPTADEPSICSARGCQAPARWELRWNNPRIHQESRRKTWLACDEHRESLAEFLARRQFLREVVAHPG